MSCSVYGFIKLSPEEDRVAKDAAFRLLRTLDSYLLNHTFLVSEKITLADIVVSTTVFDLYVYVLSEDLCRQFANVTRWFLTIVNDSTFVSVVSPTQFHAQSFLSHIQSTSKKVSQEVVEEQRTRDFSSEDELRIDSAIDSESSGAESEGESSHGEERNAESSDKPQSKRQKKKLKNQIVVQSSHGSVVVPQQFPRRVTEKDLMDKAIPSNYFAPSPTRNKPHKHPGSPTTTRNIQQPK